MTVKELIDILTRANCPDAPVDISGGDAHTSELVAVEIFYKPSIDPAVRVTLY